MQSNDSLEGECEEGPPQRGKCTNIDSSLPDQLSRTRVFFNQFRDVEQSASLNLIRPGRPWRDVGPTERKGYEHESSDGSDIAG